MKNRFLIIAAFLLLVPLAGISQTKDYRAAESEEDFQARIGFDISKKLIKGLHLTWGEELRLKNAVSSVDRIHSSLRLTYRINKWLRVGGAYTFISIWHDPKKSSDTGEKYWDLRHRAHADVLFSYKSGNWRFSFRERPQFTCRTNDDIDTREKRRWEMTLRHRFKVDYDVYNLPIRPYVSVELSNTLNAPDAVCNYLEKVRSMLGVTWELSKRHSLDFYYRFDYVFGYDIDIKQVKNELGIKTDEWKYRITPEKGFYHILGVFYEYSF